MSLTPVRDRVIIRPHAAATQTDGGVILPDIAQARPERGEVVAASDSSRDLAAGDVVLYSKYAGVEIREDGEVLLVVLEADVIAKFL